MDWMIYGANGYTGTLMAREAQRRGMRPMLAGRNEAEVRRLAEALGLDWKAFALDDEAAVASAIAGLKLVLHCAGPFSLTGEPMIRACLASGVHYLDITGEISVFEFAHSLAETARRADVVLLPGAGFDVVPSDCLAASLVEALPAATRLLLAFEATGGPSPGTARTGVEGLAKGGRIRRDGQLVEVPLAWKDRKIPFAHGERTAVTIPWGDVFTAFISTGVPDIEVYMSVPPATVKRLRRLRWARSLLALAPVQSFLKKRIGSTVSGPSDAERANSYCELWGEVRSADGRRVAATMTTPNGYDLTVAAALGIVEFLLANGVEGGYYTPSLLMGAGYAASLPGVAFKRVS
jgi:short subunit dehydrogenase-like uncharacterized protein